MPARPRAGRRAGFPFLKTIDDFRLHLPVDGAPPRHRLLPLSGLRYRGPLPHPLRKVRPQEDPPRGRHRLPLHPERFDAHCATAAALIEDLSVASRGGLLRQALAEYVQPHVLLVDEFGYLTCGDDAATLLFHVVNERDLKRRSMTFTTK